MKGLLVKDLLLIKNQGKFLILVIIIGIFMTICGIDGMFINVYMTFVFSSLSISTISYDEYENGFSYLLCLPTTRAGYVMEKHIFGLLCVGSSWIFSLVLALANVMISKQSVPMNEFVISTMMSLGAVIIYLSILMPIRLKFGNEKAKIVNFIILGSILLLAAVVKLVPNSEDFINNLDVVLNESNLVIGMAGMLVLAILMYIGSYAVSLRIMAHKEY